MNGENTPVTDRSDEGEASAGRGFRRDERAVSVTLGYALTLAVATLLVTGLVFAVGSEVQTQRESAVTTEMEVVGYQLSSTLVSADKMAEATGTTGLVKLHRDLPGDVAGTPYTIEIIDAGGGSYDVRLTSTDPEEVVTVSVSLEHSLATGRLASGPVMVTFDSVTDELSVVQPGSDVFHETDGQVVMEAESLSGLRPGVGDESDHDWNAYDDGTASGGVAVTTSPNVSSGDGTTGHTGDSTTGPRLDYTVDFRTTGTYYVYVRMKAPSTASGESDSVHVGLDSQQPVTYGGDGLGEGVGSGGWHWAHGVTNDGTSDDHRTISVGSVGEHTVNLYMREDGTQVDKIVLTTTPPSEYEPSGTGPEESS